MFNTLKNDVAGHSGAQQTDVVTLNAALLEVVTEGELHWASVRFSGSIREEASARPRHSRRSAHAQAIERFLRLAARRIHSPADPARHRGPTRIPA